MVAFDSRAKILSIPHPHLLYLYPYCFRLRVMPAPIRERVLIPFQALQNL